jgi:uncharacterized protein (TIGR02145 family)
MKRLFRLSGVILLTILIDFCTKNPASIAIITTNVSDIYFTSAISGGNVTDDGGSAIVSRGVCWSLVNPPTIADSKTDNGEGIGSFSSEISELNVGTIYYVRAYATNSSGTVYGMVISFTTLGFNFNPELTYGSVSDIDGNTYKTIQIGTQTWMAENLKTTKFNDSTSIYRVSDASSWHNLTGPGYCWYDNNPDNMAIYGALYNWYSLYAESNHHKNLCPAGWHVPTDTEWTTLTDHLGGYSIAGGALKETGKLHWRTPNYGATNESGFTALPGGGRDYNGKFNSYGIGLSGYWWSSPDNNNSGAWFRHMFHYYSSVHRLAGDNNDGFSVRCIMD